MSGPKKIDWTPELVSRFWAGVSNCRLAELNFSRLGAPYLLELVGDHLQPGARILDFGAGQGDLLSHLLESGLSAGAYEPVRERIRRLHERLAGYPNFLGVVDPAWVEPFDVVFCVEVIEHVLESDLPATLARLNSCLREGGILILTTPHAEDLALGEAYCPTCDTLFHRWQHQRSFSPVTLTRLLEGCGIERLQLQQVDFSSNRLLVEELIRLRREVQALRAPRRRWRWALKKPDSAGRPRAEPSSRGDRAIGNGSTLLYIGKRLGGAPEPES